MEITISNKLLLENVPNGLFEILQGELTIQNPSFLEAEKMGRWTGNLERVLNFYSFGPEHSSLICPRGFIGQVIRLCRQFNEPFQIIDHRRSLPEADFAFSGRLKPFQEKALKGLLEKDQGVLSAPTGSGKTVIALYLIAERKQPALIVIHTRELLNQWVDRIGTFLSIPADEIGVIGGGKKTIGDRITVALVQSLFKCAGEVSQHIGHIIIDECHRCPSRTFTEAVKVFGSKYLLGLSATPWRRDRLTKLIFWHLGDLTHEIDRGTLQETGDILKAELITRETVFRPFSDPSAEYSKMLSELTADIRRNHLIANDVAREASNGSGICLVLSDRKAHCEALQGLLKTTYGVDAEVLTGSISTKNRQDIVKKLNDGQVKVLIATGQLIGEGFDHRELSTLFLATPIRFSGRVIQYLGRVLRPAPGKKMARVFDYIDVNVGPLVHSARTRRRVFDR